MLFYSNSDGQRPSDPIVFSSPPKVHVSSVGCKRWTGKSHVKVTFAAGGTTDTDATFTFEMDPDIVSPDVGYYVRYFQPISGTVTLRGDNIANGSCTTDLSVTSATLSASPTLENGYFYINYTEPQLFGPLGHALGQGESSVSGVTSTMLCPGQNPVVLTIQYVTKWLVFDVNTLQGATVSNDGQTMEGAVSGTNTEGDLTESTWSITADNGG